MKIKPLLVAAAALSLAGTAAAQNYLSLSAGRSDHDVDCRGASQCDERDSAYKLLVGVRVAPNFAVEGSFMNYGKSRLGESALGISLDTAVSGFGIGGAFPYDITPQLSFIARLGVAHMKAKDKATLFGGGRSDSKSSGQMYAGLGLGWRVSKQVSLDASWETTRVKSTRANIANEKFDVSAVSLGVTLSF